MTKEERQVHEQGDVADNKAMARKLSKAAENASAPAAKSVRGADDDDYDDDDDWRLEMSENTGMWIFE